MLEETDFLYACMKAAYDAWDSGEAQPVENTQTVFVVPDTVWAQADALAAAAGGVLEKQFTPQFWIEHEGRRAQIIWLASPPPAP